MTGRSLRRLTVPLLLTLGLSTLAAAPAHAVSPVQTLNPNLPASACGLDFALVLDRSGSVSATTVKTAAKAFLTELADTGSTVSLTSFASTASQDGGPVSLTSGVLLDSLTESVDSMSFGGSTNWQDGLVAAREQFSGFPGGQPDLVVVITDGNANKYNGGGNGSSFSQTAEDMAVIEANAIRAQGVHMFAVGVEGTAGIRDISLQAISGPDLYPGAAITTADWTKVDVGDLSTALKGIATDLCDESVVVHRTVNGQPVSGFSFTSSAGGATVVTGADGVANFSWDVPGGVTTTITETPRAGFPLASVSCLLNGAPTGTRDGNSITVTVGPQDTIDCTFASVIDPGTPPGTNPGGNPDDTVLGAAGGACGAPTASTRSGYWMIGSDGTVYAFGKAAHLGNAKPFLGSAKAVDIEPTPSGNGYWILDSAGRIFAFGDAKHHGTATSTALAAGETVTSLSGTPTGNGYWIFTTRGRVLAIGDAAHFGDMLAVALNGPVFDSIPTPSGKGYYMVASDGGIFAFGDAVFYGSMGGKPLNKPVQSLVPDPDCKGYWLVASDGGVFAFEALFRGSMGSTPLNKPVNGMVPFGDGYLMVANDGGIFNFSNLPFFGSLGANPPAQPIVAVAVLDV